MSVAEVSAHDLDGRDQWVIVICAYKEVVSVGANMQALKGPSVPSSLRFVGC